MTETINYSEDLKKAVHIAQQFARDFSNPQFSGAHLLRGLLHKDAGMMQLLLNLGKDLHYLEEWAEIRMENAPKGKVGDVVRGDEKIPAVMEEADIIRIKLGKDAIDPLCVMAALSIPGLAFSYDQLKTFPIKQDELLSVSISESEMKQVVAGTNGAVGAESTNTGALLKFCIDKTERAKQGKIDGIIGRDKEVRMVAEILGRRTKPNVIIIGEPGVGKTALVDGFALNIVEGKVPGALKNSRIFELDFGALVAGAAYKGEVEDRLKKIIAELKQFDKAILFVDEIHMLMDKNGGAGGAAQLIKPELARGEITVIGATTNEEYRKHVESDEAFARRFEILKVDEPDEAVATRMVQMIAPYYEKHHELKLANDALAESVRLAKRYDKDRRLPDSAIDLIDRTMSVVRLMGETSIEQIGNLKSSLIELDTQNLDDSELLKELKWFYVQAKNKISHVLFSQIEDEEDVAKMDSSVEVRTYIEATLVRLEILAGTKKDVVEKMDLAAVISNKTGIPMGKLQSQEKERLLSMEEYLKKRVVGQDHGLKAISAAILENRSGLSKAGQPIGSFFFLGPTGTGKTELAKSLAEFLFADENSLIRFDMSEFKEEHSAALLYGAPPGYVGYEEGGMLVNKIRQQPYSIVLFDEIEKAHASVFDLFLQILDEGKLHDRLGKEGDFSNAVILFTSNIGSEFIVDKFGHGEIPKSNDLMEIMQKYFRPEFLGRLTEIIPFAPISESTVLNIFNIHLNNLLKTLDKQGITLKLSDAAKQHLAMSGFTPKYGARPLQGVIRNQLRRPLSRMIITGEIGKGTVVDIDVDSEGNMSWKHS